MKDIYQKGSLTYTDIEVLLIDPADDGPQNSTQNIQVQKKYVYKCSGSAFIMYYILQLIR